MSSEDGRSQWTEVKALMDIPNLTLGPKLAECMLRSPRELMHSMSYYKFAARMIGPDRRVLDIGCAEGLGTWLLAVECGFARGVDLDEQYIETARTNFTDERVAFSCEDVMEGPRTEWDGIVSIDGSENLQPGHTERFAAFAHENLRENGVLVVGTPVSAQSSEQSSDRLEELMNRFFKHVFVFGADEDVVQTGFMAVSPYALIVACGKGN